MKSPGVPPLFKAWFAAGPHPAYLLCGEGAGLAGMLAELLEARFHGEGRTAEIRQLSVVDFEKDSPVQEWLSPSFFVSRRVFVLPDAGDLKKGARKAVVEYLGSPEPSVVLVMPCTDRDAQKAFSALPAVRTASPREDDVVSALAGRAVSMAADAGKEMSADAASFLARWLGTDYSRFKVEMGKLLSFAGERREIGEREIREVCVAGGGIDPFRLADELFRGNRTACLAMFRSFAAGADSSDYHALLGAIAWSSRRRLAGPPGRTGEGDRSGGRGGRILSVLASIDRGLKGESGLSPEQVFEIHLLKLLA